MPEKVELWRIETKKNWDASQKRNHMRGDGRYVYPELKPAYLWMMKQMEERLGPGKGFPVWAWYQYIDAKRKRPDMRCSGHYTPGTEVMLIKFWQPRDRVLLSDFELWHFPLNNWYLGSDRKIKRALEKLKWDPRPTELQQEVEKSWEKIFNIRNPKTKSIQATMWDVELGHVYCGDWYRAR